MKRWGYQGSLYQLRESKLPLVKGKEAEFHLSSWVFWVETLPFWVETLLERLGHTIVSLPKVNPLENKHLATGKPHDRAMKGIILPLMQ